MGMWGHTHGYTEFWLNSMDYGQLIGRNSILNYFQITRFWVSSVVSVPDHSLHRAANHILFHLLLRVSCIWSPYGDYAQDHFPHQASKKTAIILVHLFLNLYLYELCFSFQDEIITTMQFHCSNNLQLLQVIFNVYIRSATNVDQICNFWFWFYF